MLKSKFIKLLIISFVNSKFIKFLIASFAKLDKLIKKTHKNFIVKLVIIFVKLGSKTFNKFCNRFNKELPKEKL